MLTAAYADLVENAASVHIAGMIRTAVVVLILLHAAFPAAGQAAAEARIEAGEAPVGPANTIRDGDALKARFADADWGRGRPVVDPTDRRPEAGFLRRLWAQGRAAGLSGVIYDNRDRGHSALPEDAFPQLARARYAEVFRREGLDYGLAGDVQFDRPVIGNSSTAMTRGIFKRSLGRAALSGQAAAQRAFDLYTSNHLYIYPEHRDHDPGSGDLFPAATPFAVISQGSSGSDKPFMDAAALTLAAFRPETRARLEAEGLLAPTFQMILRRTQRGVVGDAGYLSTAAHPTVFRASDLRQGAMIAMANSLDPGAIPPLVRLRVVEPFAYRPGIDGLAANLDETLFRTPVAVSVLWRSFGHRREMVLSAAGTVDPNDRPLDFSWVLLRGDPDRVRIEPLGEAGAAARIAVAWHDPGPVAQGSEILGSRVDIGVFANNGISMSAPSILSIAFPAHQNRRYGGPDEKPLLLSLDYSGEGYVDPLIWPVAGWSDDLLYGPDGRLGGVLRRNSGGGLERWSLTQAGWRPAGADEGVAFKPHLAYRDGKNRLRLSRPEALEKEAQ